MQVFGAEIPFASVCGIEPVEAAHGPTKLRVQVRSDQANNLGIAHGGLLCTMLDIAMGSAARVTTGCAAVMTLSMHTSFLAPGRGELTAEGTVRHAGSSIIFCEAEIHSEDGMLVATASGVFKPVRPRD